MAAIKHHGVTLAKVMETYTKPYRKGNVVGMKMHCSYACLENEHEPKYLNELLGNNNVAKVVANIYQDHIGSGNFGEAADDIIADYFDDSIDHEVAKNMVRHAARMFVDVD